MARDSFRKFVCRAAGGKKGDMATADADEIAQIKVAAPNVTQAVLDRAIQAHGGMGVSGDTPLASWWALNRCLRLADGPDQVHMEAVAKWELRKSA